MLHVYTPEVYQPQSQPANQPHHTLNKISRIHRANHSLRWKYSHTPKPSTTPKMKRNKSKPLHRKVPPLCTTTLWQRSTSIHLPLLLFPLENATGEARRESHLFATRNNKIFRTRGFPPWQKLFFFFPYFSEVEILFFRAKPSKPCQAKPTHTHRHTFNRFVPFFYLLV